MDHPTRQERQLGLPMGLNVATLWASGTEQPSRLGVLDLDAMAMNKDGINERLKPLLGPEAVMAAKAEARSRILAERPELVEPESEIEVGKLAGEILAGKIRGAGVLDGNQSVPEAPKARAICCKAAVAQFRGESRKRHRRMYWIERCRLTPGLAEKLLPPGEDSITVCETCLRKYGGREDR